MQIEKEKAERRKDQKRRGLNNSETNSNHSGTLEGNKSLDTSLAKNSRQLKRRSSLIARQHQPKTVTIDKSECII